MADRVAPPSGEVRRAGMDHAHYPFRSLVAAPRFVWPGDARIALMVTIVLDCWELTPPPDAIPDPRIVSPLGTFFPDWITWSHREYGARVGIFRLLEVLDRFALTPTIALGAAAADRYAPLIDEFTGRGACFVAHGTTANARLTSRMTEEEERAAILTSRDAVQAASGRQPRGWLGQDFNESTRTPRLLTEAGFDFTMDWTNDDRPFLLGPYDGRPLVALPAQAEWNDFECMAVRHVTAPVWADCIADAFAALHDEGGASFNLTLHPFVAGQAHRVRYLRDALTRCLGRGAILRATADDVSRIARDQL